MFRLRYLDGNETKRHILTAGDSVVGRAATCDVVLDNPSVSRWHARIRVTEAGCTVTDLGSSNGTYRNGELVSDSPVQDGDRLTFGQVPVTVEESLDEHVGLSDDPAVLDAPSTLFRPIENGPESRDADRRGAITRNADTRLLALMGEIARTLVETDSLSDVLGYVAGIVFEHLSAERAFLMTRDGPAGELVARVARHRDGSTIDSLTISRTVAQRVIADKVAMLATDASSDDRTREAASIMTHPIRSFMCAPLWHNQDVIGILYVDTPFARAFSPEDLELFTTLSNYAAIALDRARLSASAKEERRRRSRLERYLSASVVQRILSEGAEVDGPFIAQERDVTVLFADVVGFTAIAEQMAPAQVARMLNTYFGRMAEIIFEHDGTLDKFLGDAVMAVFGAPLDQPDHAVRAVQTAMAMRRAIKDLNREHFERPLQVRFALNSGIATAGDIGSARRREFTVLGDVVNLASRLESEVAQPNQIVIGQGTYERIRTQIPARSLGTMAIRGKKAAVEVFEVEG